MNNIIESTYIEPEEERCGLLKYLLNALRIFKWLMISAIIITIAFVFFPVSTATRIALPLVAVLLSRWVWNKWTETNRGEYQIMTLLMLIGGAGAVLAYGLNWVLSQYGWYIVFATVSALVLGASWNVAKQAKPKTNTPITGMSNDDRPMEELSRELSEHQRFVCERS
jgi:hypothetical protein